MGDGRLVASSVCVCVGGGVKPYLKLLAVLGVVEDEVMYYLMLLSKLQMLYLKPRDAAFFYLLARGGRLMDYEDGQGTLRTVVAFLVVWDFDRGPLLAGKLDG